MSPEISDELIVYTARLATLDLRDEERARLRSDLEQIVTYMAVLAQVPAESGVESDFASGPPSSLRADEPTPSLDRKRVLAQAAQSDGETFSVPSVLGTEKDRSGR